MASTAPAKSQPLHNFDLPHLKWKKDGTSSGNHQRRRSVNSPSRRPNLSPLRNSPLRDSVSAATPPYRQSPLRDTPPPPHTDYPVRQSPIRGEWSRQSPIGGADSVPARRDWAAASESETSKGSVIGYRKKRNPNPNGEVNSSNLVKKSKVLEVDSAGIKRSSKIKIKIPGNKGKSKPEEEEENQHDEDAAVKAADRSDEGDEVQEEGKNNNNNTSVDEEAKTWNLRPRKPMSSKKSLVIGGLKNSVSATAIPESSSSRNLNHKTGENEGNGEKEKEKEKEQEQEQEKEKEKEKRKLSINIALTKEEIEEDFFGWTGAKPPRRPKKRPKNIQKQLDFVFPGLWLVSITPDSYKVSENYMKG